MVDLFTIWAHNIRCCGGSRILFVRRKFEIWLPYWEEVKMSINLVPFRSIRGNVFYIIEGTDRYMIRHSVINLFGNVIMFMPYGFCTPRLFERFRRFGMFVLLSLGILLSVETIQVLTLRGSFDIDDIILNMLGAIIGFFPIKSRSVKQTMNIRLINT